MSKCVVNVARCVLSGRKLAIFMVVFGVIGFGAPFESQAAESQLVEVVQAVWTGGVNRETKDHTGVLSSSVKPQPLYLWMRIRGGAEALDRLESDGLLPIRHKWYRKTIASIDAEGVLAVTDEIDVPAAKKAAVARLRNSVEQQNYFLWRTWSMKQNAGRGEWRVRLVYADDSPVMCKGGDPCEYTIKVK